MPWALRRGGTPGLTLLVSACASTRSGRCPSSIGVIAEPATPVRRSFASFSEAAIENGNSRVWVGIHFRLASEQGIRHGRRIAQRALALYLTPVQPR